MGDILSIEQRVTNWIETQWIRIHTLPLHWVTNSTNHNTASRFPAVARLGWSYLNVQKGSETTFPGRGMRNPVPNNE